MEWFEVFGLITIIWLLGAIAHLLRFRKELKNVDKGQKLTDELAKEWVKRLYWVIFFGILGMIFSIITYIFRFFYA